MADIKIDFDVLLSLLEDENARVRNAVAYTLRQTKDIRAVDGAVRALNDKSWNVRQFAAEALGSIGDRPGHRTSHKCPAA